MAKPLTLSTRQNPLPSELAARRAVRRARLVALGALAAACAACSAPVDGEEADGPPEFMGSISPGVPGGVTPQTSTPGNPANPANAAANPSAPGVAPAAPPPGSASPPASGAAGSAGTEQVGSAPVGLDPNANPPSSGAGGSSMTAGEANGAGGSSFEPTEPTDIPGEDPGAPGEPPPPQQPVPEPPPSNPPPNTPPPPPAAGCGNQFLCDGFESAAPGASPNPALWRIIESYSVREQSANVQVSAANARSGSQALRVLGSLERSGIVADLPAQTYFVRAWLQADALPRGPVFIGLGTDQNSEMRLRIWEQAFATINSFGSGGESIRPDGATSGNCPECVSLTPNRWFCAEFFIDNNGRNATLWIDGVEAARIVNGDGGWAEQPTTPQVFLGSMGLQGQQASIWIDDVAAGPQRIGCD